MMNNCEYCFKKYKVGTSVCSKRFCHRNCEQNWKYHNDKKYRTRILKATKIREARKRKNPKFRKMKVKVFMVWREKNKQKHNEAMKKLMQERFDRMKKQGRCCNCYEKNDTEGIYCSKCATRKNKARRLYHKRTGK